MIKKVYINMCPILDVYGVMGIFNYIIYWMFHDLRTLLQEVIS